MPDEIMTVAEVAEYLKVSERSVYRYAKKYRLRRIEMGKARGSAVRYRRADVDRMLEERSRVSR